jgi:peptide/nickel transport system permease protein
VPTFALAMILQLIFYSKLGLLPLGGRITPQLAIIYNIPTVTGWYSIDALLAGNMQVFKDVMIHLILPAIPIALGPLGQVARMTRSSLLEVLGEEYITSGRSYGIKESKILWKYALKNTLGSVATATALSLGYTLVNTFLVEAIFSWPGIGSYVSDCVLQMNYPGIMAVTLFSTIAYLILNLIADIIVAVDPRVRL